jgi:hypothetical protein
MLELGVFRGSKIAPFRIRAVAQLGSALEWGSRGRGFKSRRPDVLRGASGEIEAMAIVRSPRRQVVGSKSRQRDVRVYGRMVIS